MKILYADLVIEPVLEEAYKKKGAKPTKMNKAYKNYIQLESSSISKLRSRSHPRLSVSLQWRWNTICEPIQQITRDQPAGEFLPH